MYIIFTKTRTFIDYLKTWNTKATNNKNFANLKTHMHDEYHTLHQVKGFSICDSELSHTNLLQELTSHQHKLAQNMNERLAATMQAKFMQAFNVLQDHDTSVENIPPPTEQHANSVTSDSLLKFLQNLQSKVDNLAKENQNLKKGNPPTTNPKINPRNGKKFKRYCYSCGYCTHWGRNCPNKKSGYKDNAPFEDMMGCNNTNCMPTRP